jgi:hypothetical protein
MGLSARQSRIAAACKSASGLDHALFVGLRCRFADDAVQEQSGEDGHHQYRQSQVTLVKTQNLILLMLFGTAALYLLRQVYPDLARYIKISRM